LIQIHSKCADPISDWPEASEVARDHDSSHAQSKEKLLLSLVKPTPAAAIEL
jgi:hypothetical protein